MNIHVIDPEKIEPHKVCISCKTGKPFIGISFPDQPGAYLSDLMAFLCKECLDRTLSNGRVKKP